MKSWQIYLISISALALALTMTGCETESKSIGLGGTIGAGAGAVLGGIADPGKDGEFRTRNVIVGSAIGGMAGIEGRITGSHYVESHWEYVIVEPARWEDGE